MTCSIFFTECPCIVTTFLPSIANTQTSSYNKNGKLAACQVALNKLKYPANHGRDPNPDDMDLDVEGAIPVSVKSEAEEPKGGPGTLQS